MNIAKLKSGDHNEVKMFAREVSIWVYNLILNYVQNVEDAEEVTQDTLIAALQALHSFRNEAALKTWVHSIAINKCRDFLKHKNRIKRSAKIVSISEDREHYYVGEPVNFVHPGIQLESKEQIDLLFKGIHALPENQKTALILAKLEQKSQQEISEIMDLSRKAVESLLSRAKSNLKQFLEREGTEIFNNIKGI